MSDMAEAQLCGYYRDIRGKMTPNLSYSIIGSARGVCEASRSIKYPPLLLTLDNHSHNSCSITMATLGGICANSAGFAHPPRTPPYRIREPKVMVE